MPVVAGVMDYGECFDGRDASGDVSAGQELTRKWDCVLFNVLDTGGHAVDYLGLYAEIFKGVAHPYYAPARCPRVGATAHATEPGRYLVTATYREPRLVAGQSRPPGQGQGPGQGNPSPQDRAPQTRVGFKRRDVFRGKDLDGKPIRNSAGDALEGAPPFATTAMTVTHSRWLPSFNPFQAALYFGKINSDAWEGFPRHSLKIADISAAPKTERNWVGWQVSYTLEYEPLPDDPAPGQTGGWHPVAILDQGWNIMVPDLETGTDGGPPPDQVGPPDPNAAPVPPSAPTLVKQSARDIRGENLAAPVLLNGTDGQETGDDPVTGFPAPKYVRFRYYQEISFEGL